MFDHVDLTSQLILAISFLRRATGFDGVLMLGTSVCVCVGTVVLVFD